MESKNLGRTERLRGNKTIQGLFSDGLSGFIYPFRFFYSDGSPSSNASAILVSVPKKLFRRAVKRNLLKRRIREAYRLNKSLLNAESHLTISNIAFVYAAKEALEFSVIESGVKRILTAIVKESAHRAAKQSREIGEL